MRTILVTIQNSVLLDGAVLQPGMQVRVTEREASRLSRQRYAVVHHDEQIEQWEREFLPNATETAATIVREYRGGAIVDIGANTGLLASLVREQLPETDLVLIEPVSRYCTYIQQRFAGDAHCTVLHVGCSDAVGRHPLFLDGSNLGANTLIDGVIVAERVEEVDLVTLDSLCADVAVGVLKVDAEGWEGKVLLGALQTITRCHPLLLIEVWTGGGDALWQEKVAVFEQLFALGYRRFDYTTIGEQVFDVVSTWEGPNA